MPLLLCFCVTAIALLLLLCLKSYGWYASIPFALLKPTPKILKSLFCLTNQKLNVFMGSRKLSLSSQVTSLAMFRSDNQITTMLKDTPPSDD